ncbi:NAD-dependent epimerase/dehydratase family protein [Halalkalibacter lacteus]|uniref:NAD-dependent epimerase/dehydratase family protein n=1 Tax=Halalkalibacter lacteus TaxID=3090663 RepID=UPI002FC65CEC
MKRRSALIIGATGLIGQLLVAKVRQHPEYQDIHLFVRKKIELEDPHVNIRTGAFEAIQPEEYPHVDDVFCCIGTTIKKAKTKEAFKQVDLELPLKVAKGALEKGAKQYIVVSAIGANLESSFFYNRVKGELEQELCKLDYSHIHILRPSLLLGSRSELEIRAGEKIGEYAAKLITPLLKGRLTKYQPVSANDVASAMILIALNNSKQHRNIYESDWIKQLSNRKSM